MKLRHLLIPVIFSLLIISCEKPVLPEPDKEEFQKEFNSQTDKVNLKHEFRFGWLTTVWGLDWPNGVKGAAEQQAALVALIDNLKNVNINAIAFQAVSRSDAMYNSTILPWSSGLTGVQGENPGYDPLAVAIERARKNGMEIHAWINPLRIGSKTDVLAATHPAILHPELYLEYNGSRYWNPGRPEVQDYLARVVTELLTKYDLDGVHIDDYFYPSGLKSKPLEWDDSKDYAKYGSGLTLDAWREKNINDLVKGIYTAVKKVKPKALFGVSPAGIIANTRELYADPINWMKGNYIDYLAPQQYWQIGHATGDFPTLLSFWTAYSNGIPIMPGIAAYRYKEATFPSLVEYKKQMGFCRSTNGVTGQFWFRCNNIITKEFGDYIKENIYKFEALTPPIGSYKYEKPTPPQISLSGETISWQKVTNAEKYVVYQLVRDTTFKPKAGMWDVSPVYKGDATSFKGQKDNNYIVISVNGREHSDFQKVLYIR